VATAASSIAKASKVNALWASGAQAQAREAAKDAKKWALIAAGTGVVLLVIWVILLVAGVLAFDNSGNMEY
jgi:hypothetical protein